jgi:catechol 2,3-dioxygenase-like lactoylglutathione lyase family enzyme
MTLLAFDHVNVRTANLEAMIRWYGDILGLVPGKRPDFRFPGAWLYLGDQALVHLVGVSKAEPGGRDVTLEHFAFRATGMTGFLAKLAEHGIEHSIDPVPGFPVVQVNLFDPDGNHIHVDFNSDEMPDQIAG